MFEGLERITFSKDWITLILMFVLILIAIIKLNFYDRFTQLFSLFYSEKYYTHYFKSRPIIFNTFHLFFLVVIIFNISLFLFFVFETYLPSKSTHDFNFFFKVLMVTLGYFFLRFITGHFLGLIFGVMNDQKQVTLLKISNLSLISVLSFPILVLVSSNGEFINKYLITFGIIMILILYFIRYFAITKNVSRSFNSFFYLFLYLCALEISPILIVYKMFVD